MVPGDGRPQALLIAGPTASGKSALASRLAERLGGLVVNADSMQVYADLEVLTARPGEAELARAPHALYGTVDGAIAHSVSRWLANVARLLAATESMPIFVGGTGLYFKALTSGLSAIPTVPDHVRATVRDWAEGRSAAELHATLAQRDPATAVRLRPTDPQRIIRALEVHAASGGSLADYQNRREPPTLDLARCAAVVLQIDRDASRQRIDDRVDAMIGRGALAEVERLARRELSPTLPVMRAIGVTPLLCVICGEERLGNALASVKLDTWRYAKRQRTFFRHQLPGFKPVDAEEAERLMMRTALHPQR